MHISRIIFIFLLFLFSCNSAEQKQADSEFVKNADYIQIVMFHLDQRCESCLSVESETLNLLNKEYDKDYISGKIKFISMSIQSEAGNKTAKYFGATGQNLYVVKGDSISDLTSQAFMFAHTSPERYRTALQKELDKYLE